MARNNKNNRANGHNNSTIVKKSNSTFTEFMKKASQQQKNLHYGINYYVNYSNKFNYEENIQVNREQLKLVDHRNQLFNQAIEKNTNLNKISLKINSKSSFISGLGANHITETGLNLHQTYGVPYLPGQMIKGVVNNWLEKTKDHYSEIEPLLQLAGIEENKEQYIAGSKGYLTFHDVFFSEFKLKNDIMTPHYNEYYSSGDKFTEMQNPVPIQFKVVDFEVPANLWVTWGNDVKIDDPNQLKLLIKKAIEETGLGAKTSLGYGQFNVEI